MSSHPQRAIVIGAGPAGLTAAHELLATTAVQPVVVEAGPGVGGISRTVEYRGYRMDLGGHRFFSRSEWVVQWWLSMLPIDPAVAATGAALRLTYRRSEATVEPPREAPAAPADPDAVFLVRPRISRIYHRRKFFDYPIRLDVATVLKLGIGRSIAAGLSYLFAQAFPRQPERHLEDFLVNRFGQRLYEAFFHSYTEKVWGVPCTSISAAWGAQRIKGLSLKRALGHALGRALGREPADAPTSLIEQFLYPKLGPGQLWDEVARRVRARGGEISLAARVVKVRLREGRVVAVDVRRGDAVETIACDHLISSMPIKDLVACMDPPAPEAVRGVAARLPYRDFIVVGLVARRTVVGEDGSANGGTTMPPDNWIYVQEPDVRLGRMQIMNNWSPALVPDPTTVWLGLEYFCSEGDDLWSLDDAALLALAKREAQQIGILVAADVIDGVVVRVPKAYPAYVGAYAQFDVVRSWLDAIPNLWLVGRNGMHRYNNQDHSMLTAKAAVENIAAGRTDKSNLWSVNVDDDYLEEK